ncbi:hypothetical protein BS78_04G007500, partial [Paspalum vaginatum]
PSPPRLAEQQDNDRLMPGLLLPLDELDPTESALPGSPPLIESEESAAAAAFPAEPETLVPAPPAPPRARATNYTAAACWTTMLVFGDSTVDPGNNNRLQTAAKANFPPYGMSFYGGKPTGRFSNGRLITDILAEKLGIATSIPGFLDLMLKPGQLRTAGVSFASAGSGYDDATAKRSNVLSFSNQIQDLRRYKRNLKTSAGPKKAEQLVRNATFVISAGTADLLFHYLPSNHSARDSQQQQYENQLIARVANYTQAIRKLGGRRFIFVGLPPVGCLPIVRTLLGTGPDTCHGDMNLLAASFNRRLAKLVRLLKNETDTRATLIDVYTVVATATADPSSFGLTETTRGCCGTGVIEVGQACRGRKTSKYLYWDAVHQTERMNQIITDDAIANSIKEISFA